MPKFYRARPMGAWGEGVLENDTAVDWLGDLEEQPQIETVTIALGDAAGEDDYLEASAGCEALVAAELVAYALGRPPSEPEERLLALATDMPGLREHAALAALGRDADRRLRAERALRPLARGRRQRCLGDALSPTSATA